MKEKHRRTTLVLRWLCYLGVLLLAAVLQAMPGFLQIGGVKPVLVLPVCLGVALYEGEFWGSLFGVLGGLIWDAASGRIGGYFAIMFLVACFFASCLWQLYLRDSALNFVWITAVSLGCMLLLDFIPSHLLRGYPAPGGHLLYTLLPICLLSAALSPLFRLLCRACSRINTAPKEKKK